MKRRPAERCRRGPPRRGVPYFARCGLRQREHETSRSKRLPQVYRREAGNPTPRWFRRGLPTIRRPGPPSSPGEIGKTESGVPPAAQTISNSPRRSASAQVRTCPGCPKGGVPPIAKPVAARASSGAARRRLTVPARAASLRSTRCRPEVSAMTGSCSAVSEHERLHDLRHVAADRARGVLRGLRSLREPAHLGLEAERPGRVAKRSAPPLIGPAPRPGRARPARADRAHHAGRPRGRPGRRANARGLPRSRPTRRRRRSATGTPARRAASITPAGTFPWSDCSIERALSGDREVRRAAAVRARRSPPSRPRPRAGAARPGTPADRTQLRRRRPRPAPRDRSAPRSRAAIAARCPSARSSTSTSSGEAPFCGPKTAPAPRGTA